MGSSHRSQTTVNYALRASTSFTSPAGIVNGDHLLIYHFIGDVGTAPTPTLPAGFTVLDSISVTDPSGFNGVTRLAYKIASSEPGGFYTVTHTLTNSSGIMECVQGGSGVPIYSKNSGTGTTTTATGITTAVDNSYVGFFVHNWQNYGTGSPPTGTTPTFTERYDPADSLLYNADGVMATAGATGNKTHANLSTDATFPWGAFLVSVSAFVPPTLEQEGYRWRNDDGSETTATWKAAQDTTVTMAADQIVRLRMIVNATGDPASKGYKLQYRKVGAAAWRNVDKFV